MFQMLTFLLEIQCSMSLCYVLITSVTWCKLWLNSDWESQALRHKEYWVLSAVVCKVLGAGAVFSSAFVCLVLFKPISCAGGGLLHLAGSEEQGECQQVLPLPCTAGLWGSQSGLLSTWIIWADVSSPCFNPSILCSVDFAAGSYSQSVQLILSASWWIIWSHEVLTY